MSKDAPELTPLKSSNIAAVGHDGEALYVQFRSGKTYSYPGVDAAHFRAMIETDSPGSYFHKHVKSAHAGNVI